MNDLEREVESSFEDFLKTLDALKKDGETKGEHLCILKHDCSFPGNCIVSPAHGLFIRNLARYSGLRPISLGFFIRLIDRLNDR